MSAVHRRLYNLYCVGADIKPCSINQSVSSSTFTVCIVFFIDVTCYMHMTSLM